MFKSITSSKAPQKIINQIRNAILKGEIGPGQKLYSEKKLMEEFAVSKSTLREALRTLEVMGLIEIKKGAKGGVFVSEVDMKTTQQSLVNFLYFKNVSVYHLSEIRKVLEPYVAKIAADAIRPEKLMALKDINDRCTQALEQGDTEKVEKDIIRFHRVIANCSENPILVFILAFVEDLLEDIKKQLRPDNDFFQSVLAAHIRIYDALAEGDAEKAFSEMYKDVSRVEAFLAPMQETFIRQLEKI
ncbi:MAG: FadR/GntR family transcriptional regulator [Desulfobacterales bacterium]|nr:FadR/GntR family transcriptional regulator [Desulfobacterales bacterium]